MCEWPPKGPAFPLCQQFALAIKHKEGKQQAPGCEPMSNVHIHGLATNTPVLRMPPPPSPSRTTEFDPTRT
jgi:hypothetical protein